MADNIILNLGSGGDITRAEDVAGVKIPVVKIHNGAAGVDGGPITSANPLSVSGPITDVQIRATALPVSLASTTITNFPATQAVTGPLTDTQLRLTPVPISGTVAVSNPGLTDTQLRASAVPVSLASTTVTNTVAVSGTVTANLGTIAGVATETTLATRASETSLTSLKSLLTDQTNGSTGAITAVDIGTVTTIGANGQPIYTGTATLGSSSSFLLSNLTVQPFSGLYRITGTWVATIQLEGTYDSVTYHRIPMFQENGQSILSTTGNGLYTANLSGFNRYRWRATAFTSGTVSIDLRATNSTNAVSILNFPTSQAVSGPLTDTQLRLTPVPISGTVSTGLTQPLTDTQLRATVLPVSLTSTSITGSVAVTGPLTDAQLRAAAVPVSLASTTITGTVATSSASLPLPALAATSTKQSDGTQKTQIVDGVGAVIDSISSGGSDNLLVALGATNYAVSAANSTTAQLAAGATFTGTVETAFAQQSFSILIISDQNGTVTVKQYIDAAGLKLASSVAYSVTAGSGFARSGVVNGNFINITFQNNGGVATTTLQIDTAYGTIPSATQLNNMPIAINEINGLPFSTSLKGAQATNALPVQQLNNAGRNARHFILDAYTAAPAIEAVQSVVQWYGNAAVAATTQPAVVPAGKTLRLQSWTISTKSLATVGSAVVRVRINTAGLGVLASPLAFSFEAGSTSGSTTVAMTGGLDTTTGRFPEGFEIPAGSGLAFSMAGYGPTGVLALNGVTRFEVHGYEY